MKQRIVTRSAVEVLPVEIDVGKRLPQLRMVKESLLEETESRTLRFVASSEDVDRMGDIVRVDGWKFEDYNGSFLWSHDRYGSPVGTVVNVEIGKHKKKKALLADVRFVEDDADSDRVYRQYLSGLLKSVSVGFLPLSVRQITDQKERTKLGLGPYGVVFESQELLEISAVNVPANPHANLVGVRTLVERGLVTRAQAQALAEMLREEEPEAGPLTREQADDILRAISELTRSVERLGQPKESDGATPATPRARTQPAGQLEPDQYQLMFDAVGGFRAELKQCVESLAAASAPRASRPAS